MPRTKVNRKATKKGDEDGIDRKLLLKHVTSIKQELSDQIKALLYKTIEQNYAELLAQFKNDILNVKLGEVKKMNCLSFSTTSINLTSKQDLLNHTKSVKKGKKQVKRSSSLSDEGYLTTESSHSVGRNSNHRSREKSQKPQTKSTRTTRSLSRNNGVPATSNFVTPHNKKPPPNAYGTVTPKCKPNTPHVLLRRPKTGEVALSFQGSPLLTAPVVTDEVANINIPLNDGTLLSLQPQTGLRLSQIPAFDDVTLKQLETLNKHIEMVLRAQAQV